MLALLDSGAQISCIGNKLAVELSKNKGLRTHNTVISTADGQRQISYGCQSLMVEFGNQKHEITFYLVPSIRQEVILGMDFWEKFNIKPQIRVSIDAVEPVETPPIDCVPLSNIQQTQLDNVRKLFPSFEKEGLGKTSLIEHVIELEPNARPVKQRYYPISPAIEQLVHEEIDEMLRLGVIEEAPHSPWSSPVVLVRKPNKVRLCLDSRKINSMTVKDAYPLPHIEGVFSRMPKARYISSIDLRHAFWQIPLAEASRDITCFTVPNRPLYRYCVMAFGLCNAAQALCRLMDKVIQPKLREQVFVYLDDLLVVSEDFETHMKVLSEVAECLREAGLTIKLSKSKFCMKQVKYLGYVIGEGTLKVDPEKVECVVNFARPKTTKQLRRFLGMAGWYRRFVENFAEVTAPLTDLLKKSKRFSWNDTAQTAFESLKTRLVSAPILSNADYTKPFIIQCDASKLGVGAVLAQKDEQGIEKPIAYFSQKTNKAQSNYSITELECLAAVLSVKKFRAYVEGQEFTIITDHASLKWLMSQTDLSGRLARWSLKLQGFKFTIEHRKGTENVVPDCLSRQFEEIASVEHLPLINLQSKAFTSDEYEKLKQHIRENQSKLPDLQIIEEQVYKRVEHADGDPVREQFNWKLWVPKELIAEVMQNAHIPPNKSHGGIAKTLEHLRKNLFWPNMTVDVRKYIADCEICLQSKSVNTTSRPPMQKQYTVQRPFQKLYVDLLGPYPRSKRGHVGIFIALDALTKFVFLQPVKKFTAEPICEYLKDYVFNVFGTPEIVLSDNGKQFKSTRFNDLLKSRGIRHHYTALYNPQANASERVNRSVVTAIRSYIKSDQTNWDLYLSDIGESLRSAYHQAIKCSPYFCVFGQQMITHAHDYELSRKLQSFGEIQIEHADRLKIIRSTVANNLTKAFENSAKRYNLRSKTKNIQVGDIVFRRNFVLSDASKKFNAKLAPKFVKAKVMSKRGNNMYELEDYQSKKVGIYQQKDIKSTFT